MTLECLRCHSHYPQPKRRASHFCTPCRHTRRMEQQRARRTEWRERVRDLVIDAELEDDGTHDVRAFYLELMNAERSDHVGRVDDYLDAADDGGLWPLVPDRQPGGTNSPRGSDDGCSTGYTDLAEWLDERARLVASGEWFILTPHWSYSLGDRAEAARYFNAA